jgi:hypothetical protein
VIKQFDPKFADHEVLVSVEIEGPAGPRCAPGECGPIPYESLGTEQTPPAKSTEGRLLFEPPDERGPDCKHDGECVRNGCSCAHWTIAGESCAGVGGTGREENFCGCVESRCALFH